MNTKKRDNLQEARLELEKHEKLTTIDALRDCASPKWERLLRNLVRDLTDKTVNFEGMDCDRANVK